MSDTLERTMQDAQNLVNHEVKKVTRLLAHAGLVEHNHFKEYLDSCDAIKDSGMLFFSLMNSHTYMSMNKKVKEEIRNNIPKSMDTIPEEISQMLKPTGGTQVATHTPKSSYIQDELDAVAPASVEEELKVDMSSNIIPPKPSMST